MGLGPQKKPVSVRGRPCYYAEKVWYLRTRFAGLFLIALVALSGQCVAMCSIGACSWLTPHTHQTDGHCHHHSHGNAPGGSPHGSQECAHQQPVQPVFTDVDARLLPNPVPEIFAILQPPPEIVSGSARIFLAASADAAPVPLADHSSLTVLRV
jgi:hypothetical protein